MTTAGKSWRRRKRDRPDEIRAAALAEFSARGFAAARMESIAKRAGITKATIYLYFRSKQHLLESLHNNADNLPRLDCCTSGPVKSC